MYSEVYYIENGTQCVIYNSTIGLKFERMTIYNVGIDGHILNSQNK